MGVLMPGVSKPLVLEKSKRDRAAETRGAIPPGRWPLAPVLVDDRAGSVDLMKYPPLKRSADLTRLRAGDVMIVGNGPEGKPVLVGVEVKTVRDLVQSAYTGRLQGRQIPRMLEDFDDVWLLSFGEYRCSDHGDLQIRIKGRWEEYVIGGGENGKALPYVFLEGFLHTVEQVGVRVRHVYGTTRDAALWIGGLARWWGKEWGEHKGMKAWDQPTRAGLMPGVDRGEHLKAKMAACLPGVGYKKAVAIAEHFGSVRQMLLAEGGEWQKVEGVGEGIWKAVDEALGEW